MTQQATLPLAKGNNAVQFDSLTHRISWLHSGLNTCETDPHLKEQNKYAEVATN